LPNTGLTKWFIAVASLQTKHLAWPNVIERTQEPNNNLLALPFTKSLWPETNNVFFFSIFWFLKSSFFLLEKHILHWKTHYFPGFLKFWQTFSFFPQKPHGKNALYIKILIKICQSPQSFKTMH
jgi:hypothetical protein